MGGSLPAKQAVLRFWNAAGPGASVAERAAPAGAQVYQKGDRVARAPASSTASTAGRAEQQQAGGGASGGRRPHVPSGGVELPRPSQGPAGKDASKVRRGLPQA